MLYLFFAESWVCWEAGASGKFKDKFSFSGNDGTWPADYHARQTSFLRFCRQRSIVKKILYFV